MTGIQTTDVVVIGGGCIGLTSAIALAARGTKVTLVERGLPGAANSTAEAYASSSEPSSISGCRS